MNILGQHYAHLIYANIYATFACIYSVVLFPSILLELRDVLSSFLDNNFFDSNLKQPIIEKTKNDSFPTLNFADEFVDLFSYTDMLNIGNSTANDYGDVNHTNMYQAKIDLFPKDYFEIDAIEETEDSLFQFVIINLVYSCKFLIYILFSKQFKIFIKLDRNKNVKGKITEV